MNERKNLGQKQKKKVEKKVTDGIVFVDFKRQTIDTTFVERAKCKRVEKRRRAPLYLLMSIEEFRTCAACLP